MLTHTTPTTPHQFARSKATGEKYFFPFGAASARMLVTELPTTPQFAAVPVQCETCESIQPAKQMHAHATGLQCHTCKHGTTRDLVREVAGTADDFEFYPTSAPMIDAMTRHARRICADNYITPDSALDIGAGSGKVLLALRDDDKLQISHLYAIEKSLPLIQALPPEIMIVGTDLREQSLLSKPADITFCNPPYSAFEEWTLKIIKESTSRLVYLIIPQRWKDSHAITSALENANKTAKVVDSFTFENAEDRAARAKVDLVYVQDKEPERTARHRYHHGDNEPSAAFKRQFAEQFADFIAAFKATENKRTDTGNDARRQDKFASIVPGESYAAALVSMYQTDMAHIQKNYSAAAQLDPDLLREFDINPAKVCAALLHRLDGLRSLYWHQLFDQLSAINNKLTAASRSQLLGQLHRHVNVDFTLSNIEAVVLWVVKNANRHFDDQLITCFETLTAKCNVKLYKSNNRVFVEKGWRYEKTPENTHYGLDYRIITHHSGGIGNRSYSYNKGNLEDRAETLLQDIRCIAQNLGFAKATAMRPADFHWTSGASHAFDYRDAKTGKTETLFRVRAYGNGNMHFKFSQKFILALNVEHGRLKGWIKTPAQAAEEMGDNAAAAFFKSNLALPAGYNPLQLA
jgi:uncharacterized tellurite resistance protein B-like protein